MSRKQPEVHKKLLIQALEKSMGIVTTACREVGISRDRFYGYLKTDPDFKKAVDDIYDIQLDFVEGQLFKNIAAGEKSSILFYLKNKGKSRGYAEHLDITSGGDKIQNITFEIINKRKDDDLGLNE
jgi:hypothetical protein